LANDLMFSRNGDFVFQNNDFLDTDGYDKDAEDLRQMVRTIVLSLPGDWRNQPLLTANLQRFVGAPNTKANADALTGQVRSAIIQAAGIDSNNLYVRTFPISQYSLAIYVQINYTQTSGETRVINDLFTGPNSISMNPKLVAAN
jgi:hypothetical protein